MAPNCNNGQTVRAHHLRSQLQCPHGDLWFRRSTKALRETVAGGFMRVEVTRFDTSEQGPRPWPGTGLLRPRQA